MLRNKASFSRQGLDALQHVHYPLCSPQLPGVGGEDSWSAPVFVKIRSGGVGITLGVSEIKSECLAGCALCRSRERAAWGHSSSWCSSLLLHPSSDAPASITDTPCAGISVVKSEAALKGLLEFQ